MLQPLFSSPRLRHAAFIILAVGVVLVTTRYIEALPIPKNPLRQTARRLYTRTSIALDMAPVAITSRNVPYCATANIAQQLDLYTPKQGTGPYPVVVFIHGGGWYSGSKDDPIVATYGPQLVRHGFALASVNYRLDPRYTYPVQDQDVNCALSYLYDHAASDRLDSSRIGLFGASAGGQLAAYAALATTSRTQPWYPSIKGVVDFYGVANLIDLPPRAHLAPVVHRFIGAVPNRADNVAASPVTYARLPAPPMLLFHGTLDRRVPLAQSQELASELTAAGNTATLVVVHRAGHGFGVGDRPSVSQIRQQITNFFTNAFRTN